MERANEGKATPLEMFICNNEPAGREQEKEFRKELAALIKWLKATDTSTVG